MTFFKPAALAASALALGLALPAAAQIATGTAGGVEGRAVSASTSGQGSTDGSSIGVSGTADAEARNGGYADTNVQARTNERRAMQRSTAIARDEDERARSRTRAVVRQGEIVRSRTTSVYKAKGEPPVRETISSRATPEGTTTRGKGGKRN